MCPVRIEGVMLSRDCEEKQRVLALKVAASPVRQREALLGCQLSSPGRNRVTRISCQDVAPSFLLLRFMVIVARNYM